MTWQQILLAMAYGGVGLLSIPIVGLSVMMFDSPGSTSSGPTITLFLSVAIFPLVCFAVAVIIIFFPLLLSWKIYLLPLFNVILIGTFAAFLAFYSGGDFSG